MSTDNDFAAQFASMLGGEPPADEPQPEPDNGGSSISAEDEHRAFVARLFAPRRGDAALIRRMHGIPEDGAA